MRPDGRLLAAGYATDVAGNRAVLLARFNAGGALDTSFGVRGSVVSQLGGAGRDPSTPVSLARAVALQADAKVLVAGAASSASATSSRRVTGGALVARYGADGALDCGFGTRGRTLAFAGSGFDPAVDGAAAAALQPDGGLLVAGRRVGGGVLLGRVFGGASVAGAGGRAAARHARRALRRPRARLRLRPRRRALRGGRRALHRQAGLGARAADRACGASSGARARRSCARRCAACGRARATGSASPRRRAAPTGPSACCAR